MKTSEVIKLLKYELKIWKQEVVTSEQFNREVYGNILSEKTKYNLKREKQIVADFEEAIKILQSIQLKDK